MTRVISSVDNRRVKEVVALRRSSERRRSGLFLAEGPREVERARRPGCGSSRPTTRPALLDWDEGEPVSERVLAKMAYRAEPEGVIARRRGAACASCRATAPSTSSRSGSRSPATSARWRARPRRPAPTRSLVAEARGRPLEPERDPRLDRRGLHAAGRRGDASRRCRGLGVALVAAVVGAATRYTEADLTAADRDRGRRRGRAASAAPGSRPPTRSVSIPVAAGERRQPQRRRRRGDPALRGGAAAWLAATTSSARGRSSSATCARTPLLSSRTLGARLKCELFQRTGSFKPRGAINKLASLDRRGRTGARRDRDLGRQPRPGGRLRRRRVRRRRARRDVARRLRAEDRRDPRLRRRRSTSRPTGPAEAFERLAELIEETGRTLVHPFDDPRRLAGAGTVGLEIEEDAPDADVGRRPGRRRRARSAASSPRSARPGDARHRRRARAQPGAPRRARRRRAGPGRAGLDRRRPQRALRRARSRSRPAATSSACSSARRRSPTASASSTSARSSPASRPARRAAAALLAGKVEAERPVAIVSGGNVAAQTASGILGFR